MCISSQLLCNKFSPKFTHEGKCLLFQFLWAGIRECFVWGFWLRVPHKVAVSQGLMGTGVGASRRPLTTPPQQDLPQCCLSLLTTWWPTPPGQAGESLSAFYDLLRGLRPLLLVFLLIRHESSLVHALREENCCSVTKSCPTLCNPMDCSLPGSLVLHYLPEFAQIHVC